MRLSIGPNAILADVDVELGIITSLDNVDIADGECSLIYAPYIMDYIPHWELNNFLASVIKKTRIGGTFTIGGVDYFELIRLVYAGQIQAHDINTILYCKPDERTKSSLYSIFQIINSLPDSVKLVYKRVEGYNYIITCERQQ